MTELLLEAAKELQARAAMDRYKVEYYRDDYEKAEENARNFGLSAEYWRSNAISHFNKEVAKRARTSSLARRLMGIE